MSDGPRIIYPFGPQERNPRADEMAYNATRWAELAKKELPRSLGFIFMFFPKSDIGHGRGLLVANVNTEAVKDELKSVVKRWGDAPRIYVPES